MILSQRLPLGRYITASPDFVINELNAVGFLQNCSTIVCLSIQKVGSIFNTIE